MKIITIIIINTPRRNVMINKLIITKKRVCTVVAYYVYNNYNNAVIVNVVKPNIVINNVFLISKPISFPLCTVTLFSK